MKYLGIVLATILAMNTIIVKANDEAIVLEDSSSTIALEDVNMIIVDDATIILIEDDKKIKIKPQQALVISQAIGNVLESTDLILSQTQKPQMSTGAQNFMNALHAANTILLQAVEVAESLISGYIDVSHQFHNAK